MGKNAQRRRKKQVARVSGMPVAQDADRSFARFARQVCDACGSPDLEWSTAGEAAAANWGGDEAASGLRAAAAADPGAEAWRCDCGNLGLFSSPAWL